MKNFSMVIAGAIATLAAFLADQLGINLPYTSEQLSDSLIAIVEVLGLVIIYIGRVRHGDITPWGTKK